MEVLLLFSIHSSINHFPRVPDGQAEFQGDYFHVSSSAPNLLTQSTDSKVRFVYLTTQSYAGTKQNCNANNTEKYNCLII